MSGLSEQEKILSLAQKIADLEQKIALNSQKTSYKYLRLLNELAEIIHNTKPKRAVKLAMEATSLARAHRVDTQIIKTV